MNKSEPEKSTASQFLAPVNRLYYKFVRAFLAALALIAFGYLLNIAGLKEINFLLAIVFTVAAVVIWFHPTALLSGIGASSLYKSFDNAETATDPVKKGIDIWFRLLGYILLWGSILFFFLGTRSFESNPGNFIGLVFITLILTLMSALWNTGKGFSKVVFYSYFSVIFSFLMLSTIPSHVWNKTIGFNPISYIVPTETEIALEDIEKVQAQQNEKWKVEKLDNIKTKINKGITLTDDENEFIDKMRRGRDSRTIPGQIKSWIEGYKQHRENQRKSAVISKENEQASQNIIEVNKHTKQENANYLAGIGCFRSGDWDCAISNLSVALKLDPNNKEAKTYLQKAQQKQEQLMSDWESKFQDRSSYGRLVSGEAK